MDTANVDWVGVSGLQRWDDLGGLIDVYLFASLLTEADSVRAALAAAPEGWLHAHPRYLNARAIAGALSHGSWTLDARTAALFDRWIAAQEQPAGRDVLVVVVDRLRRLLALGRFADAERLADTIWATIETTPDPRGLPDVLPFVLVLGGIVKLVACSPREAAPFFEEAHRWTLGWARHPMEEHVRNSLALGLRSVSTTSRPSQTSWTGQGPGGCNEGRRRTATNRWESPRPDRARDPG